MPAMVAMSRNGSLIQFIIDKSGFNTRDMASLVSILGFWCLISWNFYNEK